MDNRTINQIRNNETKLINEIEKLEQENQKYKEVINKTIEYIKEFDIQHLHECMEHNLVEVLEVLLDILKEVE